ncbi:MAG: enoyl-CoA hydratase-related protein [Bacilli bacterium]
MGETVLRTLEKGVLTLTLNRPEVLNAFNRALAAELAAGLAEAAGNPSIRAVVITGRGRGFCSGQDLGATTPGEGTAIADVVREMYNPLISAMRELPKPIVASVGGVAAGAGMSLALAADLRIASASARFAYGFSGVGLAPDSGASYFLPRIVGMARALELALLCGEVDAEQALRLGLVTKVVADAELARETGLLAARLASGPTVAFGLTKRVIYEGSTGALSDALEREALYQQLAAETDDFREGLRAFAEKRPPRFTGS